MTFTATLIHLGATVGCLLGAAVSNAVGRKKALVLLGIPASCGWALLGLSKDKTMVYSALFLVGLFSSMSYVNVGRIKREQLTKYCGNLILPYSCIHVGNIAQVSA